MGREIKRDFFVRLSPEFDSIDIERRFDEVDTPQDVLDGGGKSFEGWYYAVSDYEEN